MGSSITARGTGCERFLAAQQPSGNKTVMNLGEASLVDEKQNDRQKEFKNGVDADKAKSGRTEKAAALRKQVREEQLDAKRAAAMETNDEAQTGVEQDGVNIFSGSDDEPFDHDPLANAEDEIAANPPTNQVFREGLSHQLPQAVHPQAVVAPVPTQE